MSPAWNISTSVLFGTFSLVTHMVKHSQDALADITFAMRKQDAKEWPYRDLMMVLASLQYASGIEVNLRHVRRCSDDWADRLAVLDF